jgi:alkaline phosphatase
MKMLLFLIAVLTMSVACAAQPKSYTSANAHSHNDYQQALPFLFAWSNQFGSIEVDIFLHNGKLVVAHDSSQLSRQWLLDSLYLLPLRGCIAKNGGSVYFEKNRSLQLMIDIKSEAHATLDKLVAMLKGYSDLVTTPSLKIVISGSRPDAALFSSYPSWILFDGELRKTYQPEALQKIEMLSDNFVRYSGWRGRGPLPEKDKEALKQMVDKAHKLGKKIRFWNAPDNAESWKVFKELGVDYINTDEIEGLGNFLR